MPINFFDSISLDKQEIQSVAIENLAVAPGTPASGQIYFDTVSDTIQYYNGATWIDLDGSGAVDSVSAIAPAASSGTNPIVITPTTGVVTVQALSYAGGTNVGFVPTGSGDSAAVFLDGSGAWSTPAGGGSMSTWVVIGDTGTATVSDGETVDITGGTYITTAVTSATSPYLATVNHDSTSRTDTTSADTPAAGGTFEAVASVTTNATGHVTAIDVATVTIPAATVDTTYTLPASGGASAVITLTGSDSTTDVVNFTSTANEVTLTESGGDTITASLPSTVIAPGSLASTTTLAAGTSFSVATTSTFTGIATFTASPIVPTPTTGTQAANKTYVDSVLVGALVFQGGYNATTAAPTGVTILQGFTYVVTTAGDASGFWPTTLEVGDVIIAEQDNPTVASDWTDVQNNIDIATAAATDAAAVKGISGYSSAYFDVTTDGWVETNTGHVASIGNAAATALTVNHALNSRDVIVQLYDMTTFDTVFAQVVRTDVNNVTVTFSTAPASNGIRCVITKVSNVI